MLAFIKKHKTFWSHRPFLVQTMVGIVFIIASLFIAYYASYYTLIRGSNPVTDIILDHLPVVNVDFIYTDGATFFFLALGVILLYEPRRIPFVLKTIALFIVIHSAFIIMTHTAPPPHESYLDPNDWLQRISLGDDLFFSAHTGFPFLMALIFWNEKFLRWLFLICTVIGAGAVLLGHLHYSIDVFSAFFISFGILHIARAIFPKEYRYMHQPLRF